MNIIIIGGGHTALKLATLLHMHRKDKHLNKKFKITIMTRNKHFIFYL